MCQHTHGWIVLHLCVCPEPLSDNTPVNASYAQWVCAYEYRVGRANTCHAAWLMHHVFPPGVAIGSSNSRVCNCHSNCDNLSPHPVEHSPSLIPCFYPSTIPAANCSHLSFLQGRAASWVKAAILQQPVPYSVVTQAAAAMAAAGAVAAGNGNGAAAIIRGAAGLPTAVAAAPAGAAAGQGGGLPGSHTPAPRVRGAAAAAAVREQQQQQQLGVNLIVWTIDSKLVVGALRGEQHAIRSPVDGVENKGGLSGHRMLRDSIVACDSEGCFGEACSSSFG